jgi:hypothetical protein
MTNKLIADLNDCRRTVATLTTALETVAELAENWTQWTNDGQLLALQRIAKEALKSTKPRKAPVS